MTKADLVDKLTSHMREGGRADAETFLSALGRIAQQSLADRDSLSLPGIGRLETKKRHARTGRNPRTGEPLTIPARVVAVLRPSADLKAALKRL